MSKPRHKRKSKPLALHDGDPVTVTRFLENGESFQYPAIFILDSIPRDENESVQCKLEPLPSEYYVKVKETISYFGSFRLNRDWWSISNFPVELSRHTVTGASMTAVVMNACY